MAFGSSICVDTGIRMQISRHLLQKLALQSFQDKGMYGKNGMNRSPVSSPIIRNTNVHGKNNKNTGKVFHSGSGGSTVNGSSRCFSTDMFILKDIKDIVERHTATHN